MGSVKHITRRQSASFNPLCQQLQAICRNLSPWQQGLLRCLFVCLFIYYYLFSLLTNSPCPAQTAFPITLGPCDAVWPLSSWADTRCVFNGWLIGSLSPALPCPAPAQPGYYTVLPYDTVQMAGESARYLIWLRGRGAGGDCQ